MQAAELVDRGLQRLLGAGEVGDVDGVERAADAVGNRLTVGALAVEHRDVRRRVRAAVRRWHDPFPTRRR